MSYVLHAWIGNANDLRRDLVGLHTGAVIALPQGYGLLPLTQAVRNDIARMAGLASDTRRFDPFEQLTEPLALWALELSQDNRLAYVEAEYFGGQGLQRAIVWGAAAIALGPLSHGHAINEALALLGVQRGPGHDEFDTLQLGRFRHTEDWYHATRGD